MRVILVGDSTMATRTGYGDALCRQFRPAVTCVNLARGGRSTASYRAEGWWDRVGDLLREGGAYRATYVLIQFGHNDQPGKAGRTTDLATGFPANTGRYVDEVRGEGAIPVLLTPLTRRTFKDGVLHNDLAPWADATRRVAAAKRVPLLELNADSAAAVARMGPAGADTLAQAEKFDRTHLGPRGAAYFAGMVATELAAAVPELAPLIFRRPQLSAAQARAHAYAEVLKEWDPLADPLATGALPVPDFVVDAAATADGERVFNTVQSAVNKAATRTATRRLYIHLMPGVYRELVSVPDAPAPITLYGSGTDAAATRISENRNALVKAPEPVGTAGSAIVRIRNNGFQANNLTFENTYDNDSAGELTIRSQAVALMVDGADRVQFENVRFLGQQDTLYLRSSGRVFVNKSFIEGDVDFIFGDATAYFRKSEIRSLGLRTEHYVTAPSTHARSRFGFVFNDCKFTNDGKPAALTGTFKLGRQWFRGGDRDAVGKVVILDSQIGAHIDKASPWSDWGKPGSPRHRPVQYDALGEPLLAEYNNTDD